MAAVAQVAQTQLPATAGKPKPLLRGWFHLVGSLAMLVAGPLIGLEASGTKAELCSAVACFAVWAMLTTSALYHRVHWSDAARRRMRHADHSMIFICHRGHLHRSGRPVASRHRRRDRPRARVGSLHHRDRHALCLARGTEMGRRRALHSSRVDRRRGNAGVLPLPRCGGLLFDDGGRPALHRRRGRLCPQAP